MDTQKIIAIFDDNLRVVAFVSGQPLLLEIVGYLPQPEEIRLQQLVESLNVNKPRVRSETVSSEGLSVSMVLAGEQNFYEGVLDELKIANFRAKQVPNIIRHLLIYIAYELNFDQRSKIIGELVNLPEDTSEEAIKEFEGILLDMRELKQSSP